MIKIFIILFFCLLSCDDIGEVDRYINKGFLKTFGTKWYDYGWGITQLHDGGFAITGSTSTKDKKDKDMITIRTDDKGNGIWEIRFGGPGQNDKNEEGLSVVQTQDGGIVSIGYSWSFGSSQQIYVTKTSFYGKELWVKHFGGSNREIGHKSIITSDGNILIVGQTNSPGISHGNDDVLLQKINQNGDQIWLKAYGQLNHEIGYDVAETDGGDFLIVGFRDYYEGGKSLLIIKTDKDGNQIWEKIINEGDNADDIGYSISKSKIYGFKIIASSNIKDDDRYNPRVVNIDFDGNVIWDKTFNGNGLKHTRWVASATYDGGAAILGTTNYWGSVGDNEDIYLIKIDKNGNKVWDTSVGGGDQDWGWGIVETFFSELVIVGSTKSFGFGLYDIIISKIIDPNL